MCQQSSLAIGKLVSALIRQIAEKLDRILVLPTLHGGHFKNPIGCFGSGRGHESFPF